MMGGENGSIEDIGLTYKIEGNEVLVFKKEERDGGISFSSSSPKVGDQVEVGPKKRKESAKITKIENAPQTAVNSSTEKQQKLKGEVKAEDIVGKWDGEGINFIFNEDGTAEVLSNGKIIEKGTWSIKDGEIHTLGGSGKAVIYSMSDEGHLQHPSGIYTFKKIKIAKWTDNKEKVQPKENSAGTQPTAKKSDQSLYDAALLGETAKVKQAIADGADVNTKGALHNAVVASLDSGDNEIVEMFISNGANVNAKDDKGLTALDIIKSLSDIAAVSKNLRAALGKTDDDIPVADLLRKHGAKTSEELKASD
jgi:hypothetical protein